MCPTGRELGAQQRDKEDRDREEDSGHEDRLLGVQWHLVQKKIPTRFKRIFFITVVENAGYSGLTPQTLNDSEYPSTRSGRAPGTT